MRKMLLISFVFVYCFAHQEEFFLQGNKHYHDGEFEQALAEYQKIDKKDASVLFNMGNCFYHLDNYYSAIVYWRLADNIGPWRMHEKIDYNCALAYKKLGKEFPADMIHSLYRWFMRAINIISFFWWQLIFLVVWVLAVVFMVQAAVRRRFWRMSAIMIFMCSIMACFMIRYKSAVRSYAFIIEKEAAIRTGPADNYGVVATVHCLDEFDIDEQCDNWLKVHNRFVVGWICSGCVAIIDSKKGINGERKGCL